MTFLKKKPVQQKTKAELLTEIGDNLTHEELELLAKAVKNTAVKTVALLQLQKIYKS